LERHLSVLNLICYNEKNKSLTKEKQRQIIEENKEFLTALNAGASSKELNEIRLRLSNNAEKSIPQNDDKPPLQTDKP